MNAWYGIREILQTLIWMGLAFGTVGYFIFREWIRRKENQAMLERMSPEQLADIRRVDAEIEAEKKRRSAGNLWFLRLGMAAIGGGLGVFCGMEWFMSEITSHAYSDFGIAKTLATAVMGIGLFIFLEFLIELWLRRMER